MLKKEAYKKLTFTNHIQNNFKTSLFGKNYNINIDKIMQYIEVRIQNNFKIIKQTKIINNNIMPLFTLEMLRGVFNGIKDNEMAKIDKLQAMVNELNRIHIDGKPMYVHYKLDTRTRIEHFFAQSVVECGTTLELQENFNYSIESLLNDNRFTKEQAEKYGYQKNNGIYIQRANKIHIGRIKYNGRYGNMPNTDDGYNFSGKGLFHLTFRVNYRDFTIKAREWGWIGEDIDFEANPKLLFEDGNYALMSATYFWKHNQCFANANDNTKLCADSITRIINRYTGSYQERWNQYERIRNAEIFKEF